VIERSPWAEALALTAAAPEHQSLRICQLCIPIVGISGAGISLMTAVGNRSVVCVTDAVAGVIEDLQFTLGEGPCIEATQTQRPVLVPDLNSPVAGVALRWPGFIAGAREAGVRAVFAFPLIVGVTNVGALDLHRCVDGKLTAEQMAAALQAADSAALGLLNLGDGAQTVLEADWDADATGQMQVHQATGMVMVQMGVTVEEAFVTLQARAFGDGRRLADIATDVVERRLRFS
jgi:GAF domain-containing protein